MTTLKYAMRRMWRRPTTLVAGVAILATAQAVVAASVALFDRALFQPFEYPRSTELFRVLHVNSADGAELAMMPAESFQKISLRTGFAAVAFHPDAATLEVPEPKQVLAAHLSPGSLTVFQVPMLLGREFNPGDAERGDAVILSEVLWHDSFGADPNVVGSHTRVNGAQMRIVGVAPAAFKLPLGPLEPRVYIVEPGADAGLTDVESHVVTVVLRLHGPAAAMEAASALKVTLAEAGGPFAGRRATFDIKLAPLATMVRSTPTVRLFLIASVAILLLSSTVVAYLFGARYRTCETDFEIQRHLGATYRQTFMPLAIEGAVVVAVSTAVSLMAAHWALVELSAEFQHAFALSHPPKLGLLSVGLVAAAAGLAALLLLMFPAWCLRHGRRDRQPKESRATRLRLLGERALVAIELVFAASLVIVGVNSSLRFIDLTRSELGFDPEGVLAAYVVLSHSGAAEAGAEFDAIHAELDGKPGVTGVAMADLVPFIGIPGGFARVEGHEERQRLRIRRVSPDYFRVLNIAVRAGRVWTPEAMVSPPVVCVVSDGLAARYWPESDALGRRVTLPGGAPLTVVGVVADTRDISVNRAPEPTVYIPFSDRTYPAFRTHALLVRAAVGQRGQVESAFETLLRRYRTSGEATQVVDLARRADVSLRAPRLYASAGALFGWVAVLLAFGGSFAVLSQVAARSRVDLAIRVALGATRGQLVRHFAFYGGLPIVIGIVIGAPVGLLLTNYLGLLGQQALVLEVVGFMAGVGALLVCGFLAVLVPAYRVARTSTALILKGV